MIFSAQKNVSVATFFLEQFCSRHSFLAFLSMGSIDRLAYLPIACVDLFDKVSRKEFRFRVLLGSSHLLMRF